jgi:cell division protein FtsZ
MIIKSIVEIITVNGVINRDFNDVTTIMKDGGVALVSYGFGCGENRLDHAIRDALDSPWLSNNDIYNAKRILFYISFRKDNLKVEELTNSMDNFMGRFDKHVEMIWGYGKDDSLQPDQEVKFMIIATGFGLEDIVRKQDTPVEQEYIGVKKGKTGISWRNIFDDIPSE